jgi:hypothetical protein
VRRQGKHLLPAVNRKKAVFLAVNIYDSLYCFSDDEEKKQDWPCKAERGVTNILFNELMTLLQGQIFQVAQKLHPSHCFRKKICRSTVFSPRKSPLFSAFFRLTAEQPFFSGNGQTIYAINL